MAASPHAEFFILSLGGKVKNLHASRLSMEEEEE